MSEDKNGHAQAQPPLRGAINNESFDEFVERLFGMCTRGKTRWIKEDLISFLQNNSAAARPAEQPAPPQTGGSSAAQFFTAPIRDGSDQPSAPPQPAPEPLVHIFRASPEGECAICGEVDYSPIHKRKAGAAPIPYVSATRIVELPSVEVRQLPQGVIVKLMAVRDALIRKNYDEAYHQLYSIADPTFTLRDPFAEWEKAVNYKCDPKLAPAEQPAPPQCKKEMLPGLFCALSAHHAGDHMSGTLWETPAQPSAPPQPAEKEQP